MHSISHTLKLIFRCLLTPGCALPAIKLSAILANIRQCRALIYITLLWFSGHAIAAQNAFAKHSVLIAYHTSQEDSQPLLKKLQRNISKAGYEVHLKPLSADTLHRFKPAKHALIIAIGSKVTETLLSENIQAPVFSILMPRYLVTQLRKRYPDKSNWSNLLIDQPIQRPLTLISSITDKHQKAGTLIGSYTMGLKETLEQSASASGQALIIESVNNADQLTAGLKSLSRKVNILLTLPDPVIYNKKTIRGIILLTYRKKLPIIGFSQACVKAGAIAAVYSEPFQISRQTTEIIQRFFKNNEFDQLAYQPNDFSVALNRKVAHSLGINLPEKSLIINAIKRAEKNAMAEENR
ncbi:hypothetical protein MNBD_GAMMA10-2179 [hydrothermal vent metagenome]|uniref:ABC transporter substrate-binding protein n=1 Tax=hydrothermal vent metagenome TaxID=652676 RepID=A0A3B0X6R3_9ZZZZ